MAGVEAELVFAEELRMFLAPGYRGDGRARVRCDETSTLGHVVESLGVPLPEVGPLSADGVPVTAASRLPVGRRTVAEVAAVRRPQPLPAARFVLDVHLGTLARRLRLTGIDAAYANDRDDDALIIQAGAERRVLLTQDRGLLRRRSLWLGAYVRGADPDDQLRDVLDRFAPPLAVDPVHRLQRAARASPQGRRRAAAAAGHPAHLPGFRPLHRLRAGVLARRAQRPSGCDHRPRRRHRSRPVIRALIGGGAPSLAGSVSVRCCAVIGARRV